MKEITQYNRSTLEAILAMMEFHISEIDRAIGELYAQQEIHRNTAKFIENHLSTLDQSSE